MRTLFPGLRVTDLGRSLKFYTSLGYLKIGGIFGTDRSLAMLRLPGESEITLELVFRPGAGRVELGCGLDHLAIQVDDLADTRAMITAAGLEPGPIEHPGGPDGPKISWLTDPDGYRIELVEWPAGHPTGMVDVDFR